MADLTNIPKQTYFKTTLASPITAVQTADIVLSSIPSYTPGGETIYFSILDPDNPEVISCTGWNPTTKVLTGVVRGVALYDGATSAGLPHGSGITIVLSDPFNIYKDIQTAVNSKADGTPVLDGSGSVYINDAARDVAVPTPVEGYEVVSGGLKQVYTGGAWQTLGVGSATPNASTTVAGKVEIATQSEANAGTDTGGTGALLSVVPSNLAVLAQDNKYTYAGTTAGSSTVYAATVTPAPSAYATGQGCTVLIDETNGASPTINFNGLGAKSIVDASGAVITAGILPSGALVDLKYNGTSFQVMNVPSVIPKLIKFQVNSTVSGSSTTQFDITNPSGTTFRYTYDGTGTDPLISATTCPIGTVVRLMGTNFTAANTGSFIVTGSGANYFEITNASGVVESNKTIGSGALYLQTGSVYLGDSTTQFDVTNISGTTYRYTYDATGTDPVINTNRLKTGDIIDVQGENFSSGNKGRFTITGVGSNYFEVTNASGVAENDKTIGNGWLGIGCTYTPSTSVKYIDLEGVGAGAASKSVTNEASCGGGAGGYFRKRLAYTEITSPVTVVIGRGGLFSTPLANVGSGANTVFGNIVGNGGVKAATALVGGVGGTATGGDLNIQGGDGGPGDSSNYAGFGGASFLSGSVGGSRNSDYTARAGYSYGGGASGAYENSGSRDGANGGDGILLLTEYS